MCVCVSMYAGGELFVVVLSVSSEILFCLSPTELKPNIPSNFKVCPDLSLKPLKPFCIFATKIPRKCSGCHKGLIHQQLGTDNSSGKDHQNINKIRIISTIQKRTMGMMSINIKLTSCNQI